MYFSTRFHSSLIILSYIALSLVPLISFFGDGSVDHAADIVRLEFIAWLFIWAIFKRPAWFHWLLLPAFLALPMEIYLRTYYGLGISTHHLGIIAEASPKESLEFLGNKIWPLGGMVLLVILWWAMVWNATLKTQDLDWTNRSLRRLTLALLAAACALGWYGYTLGIAPAPSTPRLVIKKELAKTTASTSNDDEEMEVASSSVAPTTGLQSAPEPSSRWALPQLPSWAAISFDPKIFEQSWPFGWVMHGYNFWQERQYLADLSQKSHTFKFGAYQKDKTSPQIVVMVIGESSRYDRWSLNGYKRPTNPLLSQEKNLVSLSNVVTAVSATRLSVPILVSRKPATQSLQAGFAEKSFLSAFKEAGFKTYWLSNQMSFGQFDTPVSVFAKEADVVQFFNLGSFNTNYSSFDQVLLSPLKTALATSTPKKLIVLHTLGSHWNYSQRYPQEFDKWQPSLFGVDNPAYTNLKLKPQINNSYDNSILYTDWFLSQVIDMLRASGQTASMMYVSDHGQSLYDGRCTLAFHGHNNQFEFHIPALVWYSDRYQKRYPAKVEQLILHKRARLSTENIFHSLLDMADIRYDTERLEWSFLNKKLRRHKRYVDSYGWTNYDNAILKGDCREVIDKGKPLKQE